MHSKTKKNINKLPSAVCTIPSSGLTLNCVRLMCSVKTAPMMAPKMDKKLTNNNQICKYFMFVSVGVGESLRGAVCDQRPNQTKRTKTSFAQTNIVILSFCMFVPRVPKRMITIGLTGGIASGNYLPLHPHTTLHPTHTHLRTLHIDRLCRQNQCKSLSVWVRSKNNRCRSCRTSSLWTKHHSI